MDPALHPLLVARTTKIAYYPANVAGKGKWMADRHPDHGDDTHRDEALQHDGKEVLSAHQAAVEKGETWRHSHHQSSAEKNNAVSPALITRASL